MSTDLRIKLLQACDAYVSDTKDHIHGFCSWATNYLELHNEDAYILIDRLRLEMAGLCAGGELPDYVCDHSGRTPERIQFVHDLRAYLLLDI